MIRIEFIFNSLLKYIFCYKIDRKVLILYVFILLLYNYFII